MEPYRADETYIKIKGNWKYLYRAVDSRRNTIDFMLSENRDIQAAKRFFKKALSSPHNQSPRVITVDKNPAYPPAIEQLKDEKSYASMFVSLDNCRRTRTYIHKSCIQMRCIDHDLWRKEHKLKATQISQVALNEYAFHNLYSKFA